MSEMFQFGRPGAQFDYTSSSSVGCYPNGIENGAFSGEKSQSTSSMDQNPLVDGDQLLSWSGSATPSDHSFYPCDSTIPLSDKSTGAGVLRMCNSQDTHFDINQDVSLFGGDETNDVNMSMEDASTSEMAPSTDLSQDDPRPCDSRTSFRESTQSGNVRYFFLFKYASL